MHENSTLNIGNSTLAHIASKEDVYDQREAYDSLRLARSAIFAFNKSRKFLIYGLSQISRNTDVNKNSVFLVGDFSTFRTIFKELKHLISQLYELVMLLKYFHNNLRFKVSFEMNL